MRLIRDEYLIFQHLNIQIHFYLFTLYKFQLSLDCYNEFLASFAILQSYRQFNILNAYVLWSVKFY